MVRTDFWNSTCKKKGLQCPRKNEFPHGRSSSNASIGCLANCVFNNHIWGIYSPGVSNGFYSGFSGFPIGTPLNSVTRQVRSPTADGLPCTKLLPQVRRLLWLDQAASHMTGNDLNPLFWGRKISKSWAKSDKSGDDLLQSIFAVWFRHAAGHIYIPSPGSRSVSSTCFFCHKGWLWGPEMCSTIWGYHLLQIPSAFLVYSLSWKLTMDDTNGLECNNYRYHITDLDGHGVHCTRIAGNQVMRKNTIRC
jgi:hypothetical protein